MKVAAVKIRTERIEMQWNLPGNMPSINDRDDAFLSRAE
jgi:hypothetical protein